MDRWWRATPGPDDVMDIVPWFANMYEHVAVQPLTSWCPAERPNCRQPVPGTVPVTGAEPRIPLIQLAPTPQNVQALGRRFPNPVPSTAESIERGRDRYDINCSLCHGDAGGGDGPVSMAMAGGNLVPSLVTARAGGYSDGYIYALIVSGRGLMKSYAHRLRGDDRWHVINYMRVLQGTAQ